MIVFCSPPIIGPCCQGRRAPCREVPAYPGKCLAALGAVGWLAPPPTLSRPVRRQGRGPWAAFRDRPDIFTFQGGPPTLLTHSAKSTLCLNVKKSKPRKGLLLTCQIVKLFDFFDKSTYF